MQMDATMHDAARGQTRSADGHRTNVVVSLLLLLLMPLGLLHRSSTAGCRYDHRPHSVSAGGVQDAGRDGRAVIGDQHEHRDGGLALDGAAPGSCGPAAIATRNAPVSVEPQRAVRGAWRALSPSAPAAPPPAPPPRPS